MFVLAAGKLAQFPWGIRDDINWLLFEWIPQCDRQLFVYIRFTLFASFIYNTTTLDNSYHKFKLSIQLIKMHTIDFARKTVSTINAMQTSRKAAMFCFRLPNVFALSRQGYSGQVLNFTTIAAFWIFLQPVHTHARAHDIFWFIQEDVAYSRAKRKNEQSNNFRWKSVISLGKTKQQHRRTAKKEIDNCDDWRVIWLRPNIATKKTVDLFVLCF